MKKHAKKTEYTRLWTLTEKAIADLKTDAILQKKTKKIEEKNAQAKPQNEERTQ